MAQYFFKLCNLYWRDDRAATAVEYGLFAAGISLAIIVVVFSFGDSLYEMTEVMMDSLETAQAGRE